MPSKYYKKHQVTLKYGNGCQYHDNCFCCPFTNCKAPDKVRLKNYFYTYLEHNKIIALYF